MEAKSTHKALRMLMTMLMNQKNMTDTIVSLKKSKATVVIAYERQNAWNLKQKAK